MSASDNIDARNDRADVSRYAPPRVTAAPRLPLSATGRLAVAMGVAAAVAAASVTVLQSKAQRPATTEAAKAPRAKKLQAKDQAQVPATDMPVTVHTVAIRPQAQTPPTMTMQTTPVEDTRPATPGAETALPSALKTWAMFPDTTAASSFATTDGSKTADAQTSEPVKASEHAQKPEPAKEAAAQAAAPHKAEPKRTARRSRRHRVRHRRVRTAAKPQPAQPVQQAQAATQTPTAASEPVKKMPIQAAIDAIFGNDGGNGDSGAAGSGGASQVTTGAAFQ